MRSACALVCRVLFSLLPPAVYITACIVTLNYTLISVRASTRARALSCAVMEGLLGIILIFSIFTCEDNAYKDMNTRARVPLVAVPALS